MRQNKNSPRISKEILAAIITSVATLLAAIIGGIFVLRSVSGNQTSLPSPANSTVITTNQPIQLVSTSVTTSTGSNGLYGGTLILNDPLKDNSQGYQWDIVNDSTGSSCSFKNDAYDIIAAQGYFQECNTNARQTIFNNFAYQVSMKIVQGASASGVEGGIAFRYNDSTKSFYMLLFSTGGSYWLYAIINNALMRPPIMEGVAYNQFNTGVGVTNLIAVVANGSNLQAFVNPSENPQPLFSILDTHISSGQIGVVVNGGYQSVGEVTFNYAEVWKL